MTKLELIERISEHNDIESKASASRILGHTIETILTEIKDGGNVNISGFGNFSSVAVPEKSGTAMGHDYTSAAHNKMKFKTAAKAKRFVA